MLSSAQPHEILLGVMDSPHTRFPCHSCVSRVLQTVPLPFYCISITNGTLLCISLRNNWDSRHRKLLHTRAWVLGKPYQWFHEEWSADTPLCWRGGYPQTEKNDQVCECLGSSHLLSHLLNKMLILWRIQNMCQANPLLWRAPCFLWFGAVKLRNPQLHHIDEPLVYI